MLHPFNEPWKVIYRHKRYYSPLAAAFHLLNSHKSNGWWDFSSRHICDRRYVSYCINVAVHELAFLSAEQNMGINALDCWCDIFVFIRPKTPINLVEMNSSSVWNSVRVVKLWFWTILITRFYCTILKLFPLAVFVLVVHSITNKKLF